MDMLDYYYRENVHVLNVSMWRISFIDSVRPSSEKDAKMPPIHQFKHASQARRILYSVERREALPTLPP